MNSKGYIWWLERDKIGIATTSDYGANVKSPSSVVTVRVFCSKLADHFLTGAATDLNEESDLPEMFQDALIYKVNAMIYERNPETIQLAQYWEGKYQAEIIEAKKYGNERRIKGANIRGYDY
mgnify:CR=1 FL=1|tara:strand:+ start:4260 stop:4625 length:366 start_codon:yes stop_codon:yes gene_type:complete